MADQNRLWIWRVSEASATIQKDMGRQDAFDRVSGTTVYARGSKLPGMLYAKVHTSP